MYRIPVRALRSLILAIAPLALLMPSRAAHAWGDHTLGAHPALAAMPEVRDAAPVKVERFDDFLRAEQQGLAEALKQEEVWARQNVPSYPPRPDGLELKPDGSPDDLHVRFLTAIRVNPGMKLIPFLQPLPGADLTGKALAQVTDITLLKGDRHVNSRAYLALNDGDMVAPLEVAATAADEPDYGLDIGLWEDNGTDFGKRYGFGAQPFGNPKLEFSSQAPFHMGYFHEAGIVYRLAGFLKRTFPEYRIHMYQTLARYAFRTGHPYWGWRFTGWGLHYIEDLTQPYHATVLPGISVPRMLWVNTLDMIGIHGPKSRAIQLVSNRHLALENYQYFLMTDAIERKDAADPVIAGLGTQASSPSGPGDASYGPFTPPYVRGPLTTESHGRAEEADRTLERAVPKRLVSDPSYEVETTEPDLDVYQVVKAGPVGAQEKMSALLTQLMTSFGAHSRNYVRSILAP